MVFSVDFLKKDSIERIKIAEIENRAKYIEATHSQVQLENLAYDSFAFFGPQDKKKGRGKSQHSGQLRWVSEMRNLFKDISEISRFAIASPFPEKILDYRDYDTEQLLLGTVEYCNDGDYPQLAGLLSNEEVWMFFIEKNECSLDRLKEQLSKFECEYVARPNSHGLLVEFEARSEDFIHYLF